MFIISSWILIRVQLLWTTLNAENLTEFGWGDNTFRVKLITEDPIIDKFFETSSLSLPFGGSYTLDIQEQMDELREIGPFPSFGDSFNGTLRIGIPYSAVITGTNLPINRRDPGKNLQVLEHQINDFKPSQLQYLDSAKRAEFETYLLLTGVVLSVATSGFADILINLIKRKSQYKDSKSGKSVTNMISDRSKRKK